MKRTPSRSAFDSYSELIDGDADEARRPVRVSTRYFAKVAAWSELPRAQVTTARGASSHAPLQLLEHAAVHMQLRANRRRSGSRFPEHAGIGIHDVLSSATKS